MRRTLTVEDNCSLQYCLFQRELCYLTTAASVSTHRWIARVVAPMLLSVRAAADAREHALTCEPRCVTNSTHFSVVRASV